MDKNYFSKAGDLDKNYFSKAGDLVSEERTPSQKEVSPFFKTPGDIPEQSPKISTNAIDVEDYLLTIVSGKKYDSVCELGTLVGGGNIIVDFNRLQEMVDLGYNIVRAKYINDKMIEIEFQEFRKEDIKGMGR